MEKEMEILEKLNLDSWQGSELLDAVKAQAVHALEKGKIIFLPQLAFHLTDEEKKFLSPAYVNAKTKNISFDIRTRELKGTKANPQETLILQKMMARYAEQSQALVLRLFPQYQKSLTIARTSFRPAEIFGRRSSYRKDDTRLHVDAFPASPNQGNRILRVFTNVNQAYKARIWRAGEPFPQVAAHFFTHLPKPLPFSARALKLLNLTRSYRTRYDHYMLHLHNFHPLVHGLFIRMLCLMRQWRDNICLSKRFIYQ